jgi:hypothetical protein
MKSNILTAEKEFDGAPLKAPKARPGSDPEDDETPSRLPTKPRNRDFTPRQYLNSAGHRMLNSMVGKSWTTVSSWIHSHCSKKEVEQLFRHVYTTSAYADDTHKSVLVIDGGGQPRTVESLYDGALYVDPEGILRCYKRHHAPYSFKANYYEKDGHIWFREKGHVFKAPLDEVNVSLGFTPHNVGRYTAVRTAGAVFLYRTLPSPSGTKAVICHIDTRHIRSASKKEISEHKDSIPKDSLKRVNLFANRFN